MGSRAVKRIDDVRKLRAFQFAEDAGPMTHPIRPEAYVSMDNFYTATVYEKGAEVARLYHTLLGQDGFRRGMDLYFERHDGSAVTCDDFRAAMADANGADLAQFERWYSQAGTPVVEARGEYDPTGRLYDLTLRQVLPQVGASEPQPLHLPSRWGCSDPTDASSRCACRASTRRRPRPRACSSCASASAPSASSTCRPVPWCRCCATSRRP
jgi:aminopeptidase N